MNQAVTLPFSSQQQLLARLLHLSRLDTDFILLTGPAGAGKTHIAHLLLEQTRLHQPVLLDAEALDSHSQFRDTLFSRWFPDAIFDAEDPLAQTMLRLLPASLHKRLLVIDNCDWLTEFQLQELVQLYQALPPAVRPFMLLLGSAAWADDVRAQLDDAMLAQVLEIEVPPLTTEDRHSLWQALEFQPPLDASHDIQYPGEALDLMEPPMNTTDFRQLLEQKSVKVLLTTLIVVLLLIVIVSLMNRSQPSAESQQAAEQAALPIPLPNQAPLSVTGSDLNARIPAQADTVTGVDNAGNAPVQNWPTDTLPATPAINAIDTQTPDDSDKERVVITDEVVTQLMQRKAAESSTVASPAATPPSTATHTPAAAKPAPAPAKATQVPAPAKPAPAPVPAKPAPAPAQPAPAKPAPAPAATTFALGSQSSLLQKPAGRYTLQLMAGRNQAVLAALAARHALNPAWIYPRTINGQPWFVLVQGDYASADQARGAISGLASELQAAKPWPKPFAQVQKEAKS